MTTEQKVEYVRRQELKHRGGFMKQFYPRAWMGCFALITVIWLVMGLLHTGNVWGAVSSGLSLNIYADEQNHPQLQFQLGDDPIELIMVIKNDTQWPINTKRGFSQVNLQRSLILTDPNGMKHAVTTENNKAYDVLPAISFNQVPTAKAEVLPEDWVRSIIIDDLRTQFPMMNTTPGWYVIEAQQPFVRFAWTVQADPVGLLGPQTDPSNWHGSVDSNKLQIYITPALGAQVQARVLRDEEQQLVPIAQVPVRVFKKSEIPSDSPAEETWDKIAYILEGSTNPEGLAVWDSDSDVQCLPESEYVIIAHYLDMYSESVIAEGAAEGWAAGCEASIIKEIVFSEEPPPVEEIITVSGSAQHYPKGKRFKASFSMDVSTANGTPSGWLEYTYSRKRMVFASTEITEVIGSDGNTATIKGQGTVNSADNYTFEAVVVDNNPDSFGITIKDPNGRIYFSTKTKKISEGDLNVTIGGEPPPVDKIVKIWGDACNYPEEESRKASFSMDISTESGTPSGWLKYKCKRKLWFFRVWMKFTSTEITEVVNSDDHTATIKGRGSVNGVDHYTFEAVVVDNNPDSFGITIKSPSGETYYSAQPKNVSEGDLTVTIEE